MSVRARRAVLHGPRDVRLEDFTLPAPGPGEVRLETRLSALSIASELSLVVGNVPVIYPAPLGYQSLARVAQVGPDVRHLKVGQRVLDTYGHASHALRPAKTPIPVPEDVPDRVALAAILGEETWRGVRRLNATPGARVLVVGAGLLGFLSVFNLTRRGWTAEVLEPDPARRALALRFGAANATHPDAPGPDFGFALDCSASPDGARAAMERLRRGGRLCVLSDGNWGALTLPRAFHDRELTVIASDGGEDYPTYARWLWAHPEPLLVELFSPTLPPERLPDAYRTYGTSPRPVSAVLDWTSGATPR